MKDAYYVSVEDAMCLLRPDGSLLLALAHGDSLAREWVHWYCEHLNSGPSPVPATLDGLRVFDDDERGAWFIYDGTPVGRVVFTGNEWLWSPTGPDAEQFAAGHPVIERIRVDDEARERFEQERVAIALSPEVARLALEIELQGRIRLHRDDTRELALMYGRMKALISGRHKRLRPT